MLDDLIKERIKKLENLRGAKIDPYPVSSKRTILVSKLLHGFSGLETSKKKLFLVGRIRGLRNQGGVIFADLEDETGRVQIILKKDLLKDFAAFEANLDIGDIVQIFGEALKTQRGEKSILVHEFVWLSKSLRPLPSDWYGLENIETRLRKRYLDILLNKEVRDLFIKKSHFWNEIRNFVEKAGFLAVETPVLELTPGGADAEPFVTHHNALNQDFYLRISLELPLKRLLVAGYEKVYEIGRIFRNEGIDAEHLQDYTQLEFYWAYEDYRGLMRFVEKMYKKVILKTLGTLTHTYNKNTIDWSKKFPKVKYYDLFKEHVGLDLKRAKAEDLLHEAKKRGLGIGGGLGRGKLIDLLFKKVIRPTLIQPMFLIDPPADIEPLAKRKENFRDRVERFQVVAGGTELGKGFSENNDPIDQKERFLEQVALRESGDKEAQRLDQDFIEALEYGMPPAAGFGMSERLFAVLVDRPVRETVIFPLMRPNFES